MSDLRVNSIAGVDGTSPATLVKQSAAKAWANLNGRDTIALRDSLNVSSVVDNGTGDYTNNLSNAMANANFKLTATGSDTSGSNPAVITSGKAGAPFVTGSVRVANSGSTGWALVDLATVCFDIQGDLA